MNRKRQRAATAAPAASLTEQPPKQQYFRYVAAPEDTGDDASNDEEDGNTINTNPRYVGGGFSARGPTQREVDEVDIPAPSQWLCHDAAASSRLRTDAQTDLQLYPRRRPHHLPHSARQQRWMRDPAIGVAIARTLGSSKLGEDLRQERVICGGEVLPWGTWPARLRHHEGQSFYRDEDGGGRDDGGGYGGSTNFHASGGGVGRSGSVGGVGVVSEGSIHDELLRRQFPSLCSSSSSSSVSPSRVDQEENAVRRLVPNKRGRWVDAKTRRTPLFSTTAAAAASSSAALPLDAARATSASAGNDGSSGVPPSLPPPRGLSAASTSTTIRLIPARYGGWVEFEESGKERDNETAEQRQKRRAALTMTARFGADGGEDCRAKEATGEGTGGGAVEGQGGDGTEGFGAANRSHCGGRTNRGCDANGSSSAGASSRGLYQGDPGEQGDESDSACDRRGWTVSDPAKETVRRVWNRARRRARDSFPPRHRAPPEAGDNEGAMDHAAAAASDAADAPTAVHGAAVQDRLDPALLSCLGRECEGIIDATLHVLLADQLRRLQSMPPTVSSSAGETRQSVPSQPPPPPLETADWQDVLRAMRNCSEGARGSRTPATGAPATAAAAAGAETARSSSNAAAVHPGQERASKGRDGDGGDGVPERAVIEKEVWGKGGLSDGSVVVVNERLPGLPLNEAVLTRAYNRLLLYLYEKKTWQA